MDLNRGSLAPQSALNFPSPPWQRVGEPVVLESNSLGAGLGKPSQEGGVEAGRAQLTGPNSDLRIPTQSVCLEQGARDAGGWPDRQGYTVRAAARCPSVPKERAGSGSDL